MREVPQMCHRNISRADNSINTVLLTFTQHLLNLCFANNRWSSFRPPQILKRFVSVLCDNTQDLTATHTHTHTHTHTLLCFILTQMHNLPSLECKQLLSVSVCLVHWLLWCIRSHTDGSPALDYFLLIYVSEADQVIFCLCFFTSRFSHLSQRTCVKPDNALGYSPVPVDVSSTTSTLSVLLWNPPPSSPECWVPICEVEGWQRRGSSSSNMQWLHPPLFTRSPRELTTPWAALCTESSCSQIPPCSSPSTASSSRFKPSSPPYR